MKGNFLKTVALLLIFLFCLCGCGKNESTQTNASAGESISSEYNYSSIEEISSNEAASEISSEAASLDDSSVQNNSSDNSSSVKSDNSSSSNIYNTQNGEKICYLTFDDGPSKLTPQILSVLAKYDVKATFFVAGTSSLEYVKNIQRAGHTIGLHTDTHDWEIYKSETAYFTDLYEISNKVYNYVGFHSKIIRFPGGSSNKKSIDQCVGIMTKLTKKVEMQGFVYVDWNVDSGDASDKNVPKSKILSNIKAQSKDKDLVCVLMHDTTSKQTTLDALPEIIEYYKAEGYRFEALKTTSPVFHHNINN